VAKLRSDTHEEKVLCSGRSGTQFTVQQRGFDGTVAGTFSTGDEVKHVFDAESFQELANHANTVGAHLPPGGSVGQALVKKSTDDYDAEWTIVEAAGDDSNVGGSTFRGAKATLSADFSLANNTTTAVPLAVEHFDTDGYHDNVTNNTRLTIPPNMGGKYLVHYQGVFAANATGVRYTAIRKNGSIVPQYNQPTSFGASNDAYINSSVVIDLAAGDYIELIAYQNSGSALLLRGGSDEFRTGVSLVYLDNSISNGGLVGVMAYSSLASQTIPNNANTAVVFNQESYDSDGYHDNSTNNTRFTVPSGKSGKYAIDFKAYFNQALGAAYVGYAALRKNGTEIIGGMQTPGSSNPSSHSCSTVVQLNSGDYVEAILWQNSGVGRDIGASANGQSLVQFNMVWLEGLYTPARPAGTSYKGVSLTLDAAQSMSNGTGSPVSFSTEDYDTDGFHSTTVNPERITIPAGMGGKYLATGVWRWAANATGQRQGGIRKMVCTLSNPRFRLLPQA
jgi:hypothetical protein